MVELILTHQNADFDAVASMLGAHKLHPAAIPILPTRQHRTVAAFLALYRNGLPFVDWDPERLEAPIERLIVTDTATVPDLPGLTRETPILIYEHHALDRKLGHNETWAGEDIGAATTLMVERIKARSIPLSTLEATLLALGIYADTGMFTYGGTTGRDIAAAAWLLEQGAVLDTVRRFLNEPLSPEQQDLFEILLDVAEHRNIAGYSVTVSSATRDHTVNGINTVTQHLRDLLDADALFTLVEMPRQIQLVARSTYDAIDAGEIAKQFEGGGHARAAAAAIYSGELETIRAELWDTLHAIIQPAVRIADLMSNGVQTVKAETLVVDVVQRIRRIGHEGYPVLDKGAVVGLLTLRDADRAMEHGLDKATIREVMLAGTYSLTPDESIAQLEQTMLQSDWGQIPIVDDAGQLLGIVTRTDLIRYWGQRHPKQTASARKIDSKMLETVLGKDNQHVIGAIAQAAKEREFALYIVGGVVRDLLLERPNYDIDFVLEGDAIQFAEQLCQRYGGYVHSYRPFGTAKWHLDAAVAEALGVAFEAIPDHLDFATARSELYEHPTALPTVYNSGIKLDLRRRDFTINTLALQISPQSKQWHLLDFYGGQADLDAKRVRVLHSLSFVDDPTRILRAVRFSTRLGFGIEARTTDLIQQALPMLKRITGERLRNELTLLFKENDPALGLAMLQNLRIFPAIHPALDPPKSVRTIFDRNDYPNWSRDRTMLCWHLLLAPLAPDAVEAVCQRLLFGSTQTKALRHTAQLIQSTNSLQQADALPSVITNDLRGSDMLTLQAVWIWTGNPMIRNRLTQYVETWRHIRPTIDGNTLKQLGLPPGPHYRTILDTVRDAWIDGKIETESDEEALLQQLIDEVNNDSL